MGMCDTFPKGLTVMHVL